MWQPEIRICPVRRLYQLIETGEAGNCAAIISSSAPIDEERLDYIPYVFRRYEDIDVDIPGRAFSQEDAEAFAEFLYRLEQEAQVDVIYCCCDAGESRSPAVAAAVSRYLIWGNPYYHPNMLVFDQLSTALGMEVSDEEKDTLIHINQRAYKKRRYGR